MKRAVSLGAFGIVLGVVFCLTERVQAGATPLTSTRVASGLARPIFVTAPPGDSARLFIVEQRGSGGVANRADIRILNLGSGTLNGSPYLSISPVSTGNEEGLLGLAFHPDFLSNGYFWVYYTTGGNNTIVRYRANAPFATSTTANAGSATTLFTIAHPGNTNHNGGWMGFGPDGYLYIGTGDGGSANDPPGNAQNNGVLLGKMLRIDVDGPDNVPGNEAAPFYSSPPDNPYAGVAGLDEIWSIGLRNPWRNSFDRETGDIYIGDVGQNAIEEISFQPATSPPTPVRNYGWRCMEGNSCTGLTGCTCNAPELTLPIHTYSHTGGHCSVTGGYVYRGCAMPDMHGIYFFADYCSAQIWSFRYAPPPGAGLTEFTNRTAELAPGGGLGIATITSFGEDALGEIYVCDQAGEVFKIIPAGPTSPIGACCLDTGECAQTTEDECTGRGGQFQGGCLLCPDVECPQPEACCYPDGSCAKVLPAVCLAGGGEPGGAGTNCLGDGNGNGFDDVCEGPAASIISAVSRKTCDISLLPELETDPRMPGITQVVLGFDVALDTGSYSVSAGGPGGPGVTLEESSCVAPAYVPYSGSLAGASALAGGSTLVISVPALTNARTYRFNLGPDVTSAPNQEIELRGLIGDADGDGTVNGLDRSFVVAQWTGGGYDCATDATTDFNEDGATNGLDRSTAVGAWTGAFNCAP